MIPALLLAALPSLFPVTDGACDRAAYYILNGQYDRALKQLDGARAGGSSSGANEMLRGVALMMEGNTREAIEVFDAVVAKDPSFVEARFNRGVALLKAGDNIKAAAAFEGIAADEKAGDLRASAAYHDALVLDRLRRTADAEAALERSLQLDPAFDASRLLLGSIRERRGQFELAARSYLDYLRRHPDSALAMLRIGVCAERAGRTDVAVSYLRKAIEKAPQSPEATEARKFLVMWE